MKFQTWWPANKGDKRSTTFFAWFPITIDNDRRWLETVTVEWICGEKYHILPPCMPYPAWIKYRFLERRDCRD